ncbi:MAG: LysR family transcriptional regulator [Clostridiales bacterium]|nr:LysR family transcriptional regulator [Clostridiales bacterium]
MELFSLRCFVTLAQYLKFSEAADSLFLSQSAFSKQIQALETDLGVKLFERNAWATALTDAGKAILPYAQSITTEYDKAKNILDDYIREGQSRLMLSTVSFLVYYGFSEMLLSFMRENPDAYLEVMETDSEQSLALLNDHQVDGCIVFTKSTDSDKYQVYPLLRERLVLYVGRQHPLANRKKLHLSDLHKEDYQILHMFQEPFLHSFIVEQCKSVGFEPKVSAFGLWINTIEDILQKNDYVSILPEKMAAYSGNPNIKAITLDGADSFYLSFVTRKELLSAPLQRFLRYTDDFSAHMSKNSGK